MRCPRCHGPVVMNCDGLLNVIGHWCPACHRNFTSDECKPENQDPIPDNSRLGAPITIPPEVVARLRQQAHERIDRDAKEGWVTVVLVMVKTGNNGECVLRYPDALTAGQIHDLLACALPTLAKEGGAK